MAHTPLPNSIQLHAQRLVLLAVGMTAATVALHILSWAGLANGWPLARVVHLLFDLRAEGNISSYVAALLMLLNGVLCLVIGHGTDERVAKHGWTVAGLVLLFLSMDEAGQVHEKLNRSMRALIGTGYGGVLKFAWVVPYTLLLVVVTFYLLPWLRRLPRRTRQGVLIAGTMYVSGALLMELVESAQAHLDRSDVRVVVAYTMEESLELLGQLLFLRTVVAHLLERTAELRIRLVP